MQLDQYSAVVDDLSKSVIHERSTFKYFPRVSSDANRPMSTTGLRGNSLDVIFAHMKGFSNITTPLFEDEPNFNDEIDIIPERFSKPLNLKIPDAKIIENLGSSKPQISNWSFFVVAGFPKCGTTSLLSAFDKHDETAIAKSEYCDFIAHNYKGLYHSTREWAETMNDKQLSDEVAIEEMILHLSTLQEYALDGITPTIKGVKCPLSLKNPKFVQRISKFPQSKIIVGVRHPLRFFQSFYNYMINEQYENGNTNFDIPPPESLTPENNKQWGHLDTDLIRYEIYLKTLLNLHEGMDPKEQSPQIFMYSMEQLDPNSDPFHSKKFRSDLQCFLGTKSPFEPIDMENKVWDSRPEHMNICDDKFKQFREIILTNAKESQRWILDEFLGSKDIGVGDEPHFRELVSQWTEDPCLPIESLQVDSTI
eukprot:CAMPEP_0184862464 /NCGR_PEP_ID=MMETSP0580-20130426/6921_1 /TAXON_ID=1118495 /ORGANISM="Dactyliosolen fragilissimus" /LENGTH=421 /DNA_ID=CAMNT_0027360341 /DNA_START=196 /DNA_END=1461 /DNA_ORIENTATION=-